MAKAGALPRARGLGIEPNPVAASREIAPRLRLFPVATQVTFCGSVTIALCPKSGHSSISGQGRRDPASKEPPRYPGE